MSRAAELARHGIVGVGLLTLGFVVGRVGGASDAVPADAVPSPSATGALVVEASSADPPAPSVAPSRSAPAASAADDTLARARAGDLAALKEVERGAAGARTIAEALALEAGHASLARAEARRLVDDVTADRALLDDPTTVAHAFRLALDPAVAPALLAGLAPLDHPVVPDLLFDLASRGEPGARLVHLAEDLLATARPRATPALDVALRARAARSCPQIAALLPQITERADDRVLPILSRLDTRTGCGPKRADDCQVCLREPEVASALEAARDAARARPFAAPWRRPQRGSAQQRKPVE